MKKKLLKINMPLSLVKPVCIVATLCGVFFLVTGNWAAGLCMLLGSYLFEKNMYCCPACGRNLDMKYPLMKDARCPHCMGRLK